MIKKLLISFFIGVLIPYFANAQGFTELSDSLGFFWTYGDGEYGGGLSFVDFDLDGKDDITITSGPIDLIFYHKNTGDDFELIPSPVVNGSETKQVLWVDYDNDGDLDLYVCSKVTNQLYKNLGNSEFLNITSTCGFNDPINQSFAAVWFDYDEDGLLDLAVSHRFTTYEGIITLYKNLGGDQFENVTEEVGIIPETGSSVLVLTTFDFNHDGWEDLYVGQDYSQGNMLFKNNGDGTFDDVSISSGTDAYNNTMSATVGDYNNDSWMDLYITNTPQGNSFFINQGDETFVEMAEEKNLKLDQFTWGAVFVDVDNDMDLDLYINGIENPWTTNSNMMMNPGDDTEFIKMNEVWDMEDDENNSIGNAIGDWNNDGFADIMKVNNGENHTFWENDHFENNYIKIDLRAQVSNFFAVGSVIQVSVDGIHQYRRIACGEGFASQNSYTQMFGLAQYETIDSIIVNWPNGIITSYYDIDVNQTILLEETSIGCGDETACNFDPFVANTDLGLCEYAGLYYDCEDNCLNDSDGDEICDELEIPGCQDPEACNYSEEATDSDGSCIYPEPLYDCDGNCLEDDDMDGICNGNEIAGCTDPSACNFDEEATDDDGSCDYVELNTIVGQSLPVVNEPETYSYLENEGSSYEWTIDGGSIESGQGTSEVSVIWTTSGVGLLQVRETLAEGCIGEWVDYNVTISPSNILEYNNIEINVYPNPAEDVLWIYNNFNEPVPLLIYDSKGNLVKSLILDEKEKQLNIEDLASGKYMIIVDPDGIKVKIKRVIIN